MSDWRNCGDDTFTLHKTLGRPKLQLDENISEVLRTKILNANKTAGLLSTHIPYDNFLLKKDITFLNGGFFGCYISWAFILQPLKVFGPL